MASPALERLHDQLGLYLDGIKLLFKPGAKVTLVVRNPTSMGDAGVVIGDDDLDAAIDEIQKQRKTGTVTGGTTCTDNSRPGSPGAGATGTAATARTSEGQAEIERSGR